MGAVRERRPGGENGRGVKAVSGGGSEGDGRSAEGGGGGRSAERVGAVGAVRAVRAGEGLGTRKPEPKATRWRSESGAEWLGGEGGGGYWKPLTF